MLALPFDLVWHDMLMDRKPLPAVRIRSIVDELVLPLVRIHHAVPDGLSARDATGRHHPARAGSEPPSASIRPPRQEPGDRDQGVETLVRTTCRIPRLGP